MEIRSKEMLQPAIPSTKPAAEKFPAPSKGENKKDLFGEKLESALSADRKSNEKTTNEKQTQRDKKQTKKIASEPTPAPTDALRAQNSQQQVAEKKNLSTAKKVEATSQKSDPAVKKSEVSLNKTETTATKKSAETASKPAKEQTETKVAAPVVRDSENSTEPTRNQRTAQNQQQTQTLQEQQQQISNLLPAQEIQAQQQAQPTAPTLANPAQSIPTITPDVVSKNAVNPYANVAQSFQVGEEIAKLTNMFPDAQMSIETTANTTPEVPNNSRNATASTTEKIGLQSQSVESELAALLGLSKDVLSKNGEQQPSPVAQAFALNRKAENFNQNQATPQESLLTQPSITTPQSQSTAQLRQVGNKDPEIRFSDVKIDTSSPLVPTPNNTESMLNKTVGAEAIPPTNSQTAAPLSKNLQQAANAQPINGEAMNLTKPRKEFNNTLSNVKTSGAAAQTLNLKDVGAATASVVASTPTLSDNTEKDSKGKENNQSEKMDAPKLERALAADAQPLTQQREATESKEAGAARPETTESLSKGAMHRAVQTAARLQAQGGGTARIQLNDSKLGNIDLRVTVTAGQNVHVEIKSKDQKLRNNLEERMDDLRTSLGQHKLNLSECRVISETAQARNETDNRSGNRPDQQLQQQANSWNSPNQQGSQRNQENGQTPELATSVKPVPKQVSDANIAPKTNIQRGANGSLKVTA